MQLSRAALKSSLEVTFTQACPEIACVLSAGHPELKGEQFLHIFQAPLSVPPLAFYARAMALTWADATVDSQGQPWPGRHILDPEELQLPGFLEIQEDLLCGEFVATESQELLPWFVDKAAEAGALVVFGPVQAAWQVLDRWNLRRCLFRTAEAWVLVEWGTSA